MCSTHLCLPHELREAAAGLEELRVRPRLRYAAVRREQHQIRAAHELQLVRHQHARHARQRAAEAAAVHFARDLLQNRALPLRLFPDEGLRDPLSLWIVRLFTHNVCNELTLDELTRLGSTDLCVQSAQRVVEQHDVGAGVDGAGDRYALLLPAANVDAALAELRLISGCMVVVPQSPPPSP